MPLVAVCSHCSAKLKLKDDSLVGKKARCPKCQETFLIKPASIGKKSAAKAPVRKKKKTAPADDFLGGIDEDDYGDFEDDFGDADDFGEALPSTKKKKGKKKGKKRKKSGGGGLGKIALIAGGVIAALGLLAAFFIFALPLLMGLLNSSASRMAWLPDDTEIVIEVRVNDLWNSAAMAPIRDGEIGRKMKADLEKDGGSIEDIDRIVMGGTDKPITVIYANKRLDPEDIKKQGTPSEYGGYTIYTRGGNASFSPSAKIAVVGPEAKVKAVIDKKGVSAAAEKFKFMPSRGDVVIASTKFEPSSLPPQLRRSGFTASDVESTAVVLNFGTDIDANMTFNCTSSENAEKMSTAFDEVITEAKTQMTKMENAPAGNPFVDASKMKSIVESAKKTIDSYNSSASGSQLTISATVPGQLIADAVGLAGNMVPNMLPNFGGSPSSPPVFTPGSPSP